MPVSPLLALSPADARFQELFEQAPVSMQILAPDGRTLRVNQAWEDLWQIHRGSALHALILSADFNVLTDAQLVANGVAPLLARACAGEPVELPVIRYDVAALGQESGNGEARWVSARAHPIKDDAGNTLEVVLMHEDISKRVQAETTLRIREERFRSLVMASAQIVWSTGPDGRVVEDSPSWRAFTGQSYDEWKEFGWADAVHPEQRDGVAALWRACVASRSVFDTEYRIRCADGSYRWVAVKGVPIVDADNVVREWIGAHTDIHELVMARVEQTQRLEREKRNSALLAKVAQASRVVHTALSRKQIAEALVVEVRDILEVHHAVVSLTEDENSFEAINAVSWSDNDAHDHHAAARSSLAVPLIDRNGKNIGLIQASDKFTGDFTDEDEAILVQLASIAANGFENARLYGALQEQDRSKDEFLAMLAHELRNPLAPISTAADMLRLCKISDARVVMASDVISRQVRHLTSLVDDLLDVSRVTRGLIQLRGDTVDIMQVVAGAVEQSRPLIDTRRHALLVDTTAGAIHVTGDFHRLVQVLVNLLNNAAKYTPPGGEISLRVERQASGVTLRVRDNGIGIDSRLLPRVFDLFAQAERSSDRAQGGLGIGLALVKTIVTLHGGNVAVRSDGPGTGSEFSVTLHTIDTVIGLA